MIMLPNKNATAGTASIQNIQRHVGAPNQKISPAPPAILARIALLRNALNSPTTIANCCSEARRPRICAGATSAMYIGANTLAPPMATPAVIRTAMKKAGELAAPVATAVTRNRIAFKSIVGRRPRESASLPAPKAPVAKRKISAYHSAKMRKMRDALVSSENSAEQFKKRVKNYEHDRWHRNWRNQQDNGAARKKHAEGQQNSEDRAGRADGRINSRRPHHCDD